MARSSGTWKKGQSGNPKGRPPTAVHQLIAASMRGKKEAVIAKLEELALNGDTTAAKYLADRLFPHYKQTSPPVTLPALSDSALTLTDKAHVILAAIGTGQLPIDLGRDLLSSLAGVARVAEIDELEARISALEQQNDRA